MSQPVVTLTILTDKFEEFKKQATLAAGFTDYIQIDVMDGKFVPNHSFTERREINDLNLPLKYELHLMVTSPVAELRSWQMVENVFRVLFHYETIRGDALQAITFAKREGWEIGLVLNPETQLEEIEPFLDRIDVVQFMTVHPGAQGAPFESSVLTKIKKLADRPKHPKIAVDGAVNLTTVPELKAAGVEIYNVGSFFTRSADMLKSYQELTNLLK